MADTICALLEELAEKQRIELLAHELLTDEVENILFRHSPVKPHGPGTAAKEEYGRKATWFNNLQKSVITGDRKCDGCSVFCGPMQPIWEWIEEHYPHRAKQKPFNYTEESQKMQAERVNILYSDGCGQVYTNGNSREQIGVICELPKGHEGSHLSGTFVWEGVLGQSNVGLNNLPVSYGRCAAAKESEPGHQRYCILQAGHGGTHRSSGTFSWEGWVDDSR